MFVEEGDIRAIRQRTFQRLKMADINTQNTKFLEFSRVTDNLPLVHRA